jgi:hypothetical protein
MSGSIAALSAFSATGTQGSAVVESLENDGDVLSVVYNKNDTTRQLITGTTIVEGTEQGGGHPNGLNNSSTTYIINSDVDLVGELYLNIDYSFKKEFKMGDIPLNDSTGEDYADFAQDYKTKFMYEPFVKKVEILVGTQVFQTIYPADILTMALLTGHVPHPWGSLFVTGGPLPTGGGASVVAHYEYGSQLHVKIPTLMDTIIPSFSNFTDQRNNGYVMAAAPHQDMAIRIHWGDGKVNNMWQLADDQNVIDTATITNNSEFIPVDVKLNRASLYMKNTTISNAERKLVLENPFSKRVTFNQTVFSNRFNVRVPNPAASPPVAGIKPPYTMDINCDSFSNYSSGIYITRSQLQMPGVTEFYGYENTPCWTVELLLNGTSFTGEIDMMLLQMRYLQNCAPNSPFASMLGGIYIPLSNNIYGSGVPFNRFDTITVRIKYSWPDYILTAPFSNVNADFKPYAAENIYYAVTSVGETSILYSGGAASITRF